MIKTMEVGAGLDQRARGNFTADVSGCFHCGPDHSSPKTFQYEVYVEFHHEALDERGFLLDNLDFDAYFKGLKTVEESCERIAVRAACTFWRMSAGRCVLVKVAIWGIAGVARVRFTLRCDPAEVGL